MYFVCVVVLFSYFTLQLFTVSTRPPLGHPMTLPRDVQAVMFLVFSKIRQQADQMLMMEDYGDEDSFEDNVTPSPNIPLLASITHHFAAGPPSTG